MVRVLISVHDAIPCNPGIHYRDGPADENKSLLVIRVFVVGEPSIPRISTTVERRTASELDATSW